MEMCYIQPDKSANDIVIFEPGELLTLKPVFAQTFSKNIYTCMDFNFV